MIIPVDAIFSIDLYDHTQDEKKSQRLGDKIVSTEIHRRVCRSCAPAFQGVTRS